MRYLVVTLWPESFVGYIPAWLDMSVKRINWLSGGDAALTVEFGDDSYTRANIERRLNDALITGRISYWKPDGE